MMSIPEMLDHRAVDWQGVRRTTYMVHQHLQYQYPGPIRDLRQRLVVFPPDLHGGQRLIEHQMAVSVPGAHIRCETDQFGNRVYVVELPIVEEAVSFEAWITVERRADTLHVPCMPAASAPYLDSTPLTEPDEVLREVAMHLAAGGAQGLDLAHVIMAWVYQAMSYVPDATSVRTTAAQALALGQGVCQDYAHIMLVLCRLCGLPARYVSGHLLGEGGTHAWVEVIVPDEATPGALIAVPFDPTHNRRSGPTYITVAVGREYRDVTPTSGTFHAPYAGRLTARKRAGLVALERGDGAAA